MNNEQLVHFLTHPPEGKKRACQEAIEWIGGRDLATAWRECPRGDWMLYLLQYTGVGIRLLTACKAAAVEVARPYMGHPDSIAALDAAHAFGRWEINAEELKAYAGCAVAAKESAAAAYAAAAYAAAYAAYAAAAEEAASSAAAAAAYASTYAAHAARQNAHAKTADNIRAVIPNIKIMI